MARAITLVESRRGDHREQAQELLVELLPHAGGARRVGISGVPGVGQVDLHRPARGRPHRGRLEGRGARRRPVVRPVGRLDPRRQDPDGAAGGRPARVHPAVADLGTLGGVAQATRESMVVVEAAGYDVVLVETVGVGQSEITVAEMVDSFLFLTIARTGDQLQGIKRGILEIADVIAVNKADGAGAPATPARPPASWAARSGCCAGTRDDGWDVPVLTCAGLTGEGLDEVWAKLVEHQDRAKASGEFEERRRTAAGALDLAAGARRRWSTSCGTHPGVRSAGPGPGEGGARRRADARAGRPADPATPSSPPDFPAIMKSAWRHAVRSTACRPANFHDRRRSTALRSVHRSRTEGPRVAEVRPSLGAMDFALYRTIAGPRRRLHHALRRCDAATASRRSADSSRPGEWRRSRWRGVLRGRGASATRRPLSSGRRPSLARP